MVIKNCLHSIEDHYVKFVIYKAIYFIIMTLSQKVALG